MFFSFWTKYLNVVIRSIIPYFSKRTFPYLFFFIFVFSKQLTVNVQYNFLPMIGFKQGSLESEATALPIEPQPLPDPLVSLIKSIYGRQRSILGQG